VGRTAEDEDENGGRDGGGQKSTRVAGGARDDDVLSTVMNSCADLRRRVDKEEVHLHSMSVRTGEENKGGTHCYVALKSVLGPFSLRILVQSKETSTRASDQR
jgi:hypothetical protein